MSIKRFSAKTPAKLMSKYPGNNAQAKIGHVNEVIDAINEGITGVQITPVDGPFQFYPPAGLTTAGVKFAYADGVDLISYHIKGIIPINFSNSNNFQSYLCSIKFSNGFPFIFPGSITGMFQSGGTGYFTTTPLANGGLIEVNGTHLPVSDFQISLNEYSIDNQLENETVYAIVMSGYVEETGDITGLAAYDYEFLMPHFITPPVIFQD